MTVTTDLVELEKCGFITDFSDLKGTCLGSPTEVAEHASFARFWKIAFHVMRSLILANLRHTDGLPYMLAGMLDDRHSCSSRRLKEFGKIVDAFEEASKRTEPAVAAAVNRSQLQTTAMKLASLFAKAGQYKDHRVCMLADRTLVICVSRLGSRGAAALFTNIFQTGPIFRNFV